ncbi:ribosome biogenesis protein nop16 domain-containing protein [Ditylenchus destructor]|uniref:Nucleolar protein 16 n=1 Tax=Ditylenchus destructor TaxID=166010 RepID=A0AAD4NL58_9BILA|nr:ribosome biogenesis protein nop16 domain-containing protein [Ditylenchus destructor]
MRSVKHGGKKAYKHRNAKSASRKDNKRFKKRQKATVQNKILEENWSDRKTVQQNIQDMGLAYDPNKLIGLSISQNAVENEMEVEDLSVARAAGSVGRQKRNIPGKIVDQIESAAENATKEQQQKSEHRISKDDVKFCSRMIEKHGLNYKAMARDSENIWQHSPKQIQRKIKAFKKSSVFKNTELVEMET